MYEEKAENTPDEAIWLRAEENVSSADSIDK